MTEHVIIRNADLNAVDLIEVKEAGVFTQTYLGRAFRKVDANGMLVDVHPGDRLWVAQAGRGVIAESTITDVPPVVVVGDLPQLERLRKDPVLKGLDSVYWDSLRDDLMNSPGKALFMNVIPYKCVRHLPPKEIFRLNLKRGAQNSWYTLGDDAETGLLALRGVPVVTGDTEDLEHYGNITSKVKNLAFQVWGTGTPIPAEAGETNHWDHWIPKSLGGPGIFVENVVPLPGKVNMKKSAAITAGFIGIAKAQSLLLPEDLKLDWQMFPEGGSTKAAQASVVRRVTSHVKEWPVARQKSFYFAVMEWTIQDLRARFTKGGVPVPDPL